MCAHVCEIVEPPSFFGERSFEIKNFFGSVKRQEIEAEDLAAQQSLAVVEYRAVGKPNGFVELVIFAPDCWIRRN
jgi:hypothetical protein